jgi:regulator of replication initiation timing
MELNLEEQVKQLKLENDLLKQRLSNYTNSPAYKKYYEANKETLMKKSVKDLKLIIKKIKKLLNKRKKNTTKIKN